MDAPSSQAPPCLTGNLDLVLVVDVECTCSGGDTPAAEAIAAEDMEIIEIGAAWCTGDGQLIDTFSRLVRPTERPRLTPFATELTGITDAMLATAKPLDVVLYELALWMAPTVPHALMWASWGASDRKQLDDESKRKGADNPLGALTHFNLKSAFAKSRRIKQVGMRKALEIVGLANSGQNHRARDDATNIVRLMPHTLLSEKRHAK